MKKFILSITFVLFSFLANAQYELTPKGIINDTENDYIVLEFPNKTQQELYDAVHLLINSTYVSPQNVLSVVDGQSITINGIGKVYRPNPVTNTYDLNYTITFLFKDGRVRINNPYINRISTTGYNNLDLPIIGTTMIRGVFTKKGKVSTEKTKLSIEKFFNTYLDKVKKSIDTAENIDW